MSSPAVDSAVFTIYCHIHRESGKRYVGQTRDTMEGRWRRHVVASQSRARGCAYFMAAIRKHGPDAFDHEVLEVTETREAANAAEQFWIACFGSTDPTLGYNLTSGGDAGYTYNTETRARMSDASRRTVERLGPDGLSARSLKRAAGMSPEERSACPRKGAQNMGPEACSARARKGAQTRGPEGRRLNAIAIAASLGPEGCSARVRKANETRGAEGRARAAQKSLKTLGPEGLSARSKKAWANRRARAAEMANVIEIASPMLALFY